RHSLFSPSQSDLDRGRARSPPPRDATAPDLRRRCLLAPPLLARPSPPPEAGATRLRPRHPRSPRRPHAGASELADPAPHQDATPPACFPSAATSSTSASSSRCHSPTPYDTETDAAATQYDCGVDDPSLLPEQP
uniref:Uncharacterized protein n=1 Tax=Triticum urartu TaxID=4572 RepID=A0A8R7TSL8_TRIUA